jgi:hypothetical protein
VILMLEIVYSDSPDFSQNFNIQYVQSFMFIFIYFPAAHSSHSCYDSRHNTKYRPQATETTVAICLYLCTQI